MDITWQASDQSRRCICKSFLYVDILHILTTFRIQSSVIDVNVLHVAISKLFDYHYLFFVVVVTCAWLFIIPLVVADLVSDEEGAAASIRSSQSRSRSVPRSSRSTQQNGRTPHNESVNNNNNSRNNGKFSPPRSTSGGGFGFSTPITSRRESDEIGSLDAYQDGRQRSHSRNRQHHHQDNNWSFPDVQVKWEKLL